MRILCDRELLDLTWTRYEPGEHGPDPHVHHRHVDAFYVLEGGLVFGLGPFDSHDPPAGGGRPLSEAVVHLPGEGERAENEERVRLVKAEPAVLELDVVPGWTVDAHRHDDHLDSFFVLAGHVEFAGADGAAAATTGAFMAAPPGAVHGIRSTGPGRARAAERACARRGLRRAQPVATLAA